MGSSQNSDRIVTEGLEGKIRFTLQISPEQIEYLSPIVRERSGFKYPYLCSVEKMNVTEASSYSCQTYCRVTVDYQPYQYLLYDIKQRTSLQQVEIQRIIYAVCSALLFLQQRKYRHGDICSKMICRAKNEWKLVDNYFIKGGISAYEKVLEGDEGFISPTQMDKIRHGFVRESPIIQESDEVFALGMTCLQLMTGRSSSSCYKSSYVRFNEKIFNETVALAYSRFPSAFSNLVFSMLSISEDKRICIKDIMAHPCIIQHSKKYSLRG